MAVCKGSEWLMRPAGGHAGGESPPAALAPPQGHLPVWKLHMLPRWPFPKGLLSAGESALKAGRCRLGSWVLLCHPRSGGTSGVSRQEAPCHSRVSPSHQAQHAPWFESLHVHAFSRTHSVLCILQTHRPWGNTVVVEAGPPKPASSVSNKGLGFEERRAPPRYQHIWGNTRLEGVKLTS